jgi:ferredoxin
MPAGGLSNGPGGAVGYRSRGVVLVTGPAERALAAARELEGPLRVVAFCDGPVPKDIQTGYVTLVAGRIVEVLGYLGRFTAQSIGKSGERLDAGPFSANEDGSFDLVLDLNPEPLLRLPVPPPGYHAPVDDAALAVALVALRESVGEFSKPRFFAFDPGLCTHGARGIEGCHRCVGACPAGAIASAGEAIAVEPHLCQGCATCTVVCPTGALSYAGPTPKALFDRVMADMERVSPHYPCGVVVAETGSAASRTLPAGTIWVETPALAAIGMEWWLAVLASGGSVVVLCLPTDLPGDSAEAIEHELALARHILEGIGGGRDRIVAVREDNEAALEAAVCGGQAGMCRVAFEFDVWDKRSVLFRAIDSITHALGTGDRVLSLPDDAPFGRVVVGEACTVCLACTNLCPTGALLTVGNAWDALAFIEERCVQCGICAAGCPERAIELEARLDCHGDRRGRTEVLRSSEAVRCIECGAAFMGRRVLDAGIAILENDPAFAGKDLDLLRLCPECRQKRHFGV